ncbi:MAG TPA: hypothetical protein VE758_02830, partial [Chthoniobacterales bacterium]|nr:hypothetical protein [Chthoniobacterales bacterium]
MSIFAAATAAIVPGCATHPRFATTSPLPPAAVLELHSEARAATLHFPPGSYSLDSEDQLGYYYGSPTGVIEHTAAGPRRRDGGIFVSKRNANTLRGYVIMPYGLTHVGNLSHTSHEFHEALVPAEGPK